MKKTTIIAALAVALAGIGMNTYAITPTPTTAVTLGTNMGVSLQLSAACALALSPGIVFTKVPVNKGGTWASSTAVLAVTGCGAQYNLTADGGGNGTPSTTRRLIGGTTATEFLAYSLSITGTTPVKAIQQWGDTGRQLGGSATNPDSVYAVTTGTDNDSFNIVATATLSGVVGTNSAQTYTDAVVVTIEF